MKRTVAAALAALAFAPFSAVLAAEQPVTSLDSPNEKRAGVVIGDQPVDRGGVPAAAGQRDAVGRPDPGKSLIALRIEVTFKLLFDRSWKRLRKPSQIENLGQRLNQELRDEE